MARRPSLVHRMAFVRFWQIGRRWILLVLVVAVGSTVLGACSRTGRPLPNHTTAPAVAAPVQPTGDSAPTQPQRPAPPPARTVTITVVGDLLMHLPIVEAARTATGYDFRPVFAAVGDELAKGDLTLANLETTLGGPERGYRGYPRFNTPDELLEALRHYGVTTLITANNHALDSGADGLRRTLERIRQAGLEAVGTRAEPGDPPFLLVQQDGVRLAILAYTYGTNGIAVPEPHLINLIDEARIRADVEQARRQGAQLILVAMHWGVEYQRQPNEEQRRLARFLHDLGVHAVLGTHPHVVQPVEVLSSRGADGTPRTTAVLYSTGNFVSNQRWRYSDAGAIFHLSFRLREPAALPGRTEVRLERIEYVPVWVHKDRSDGTTRFRVLPARADAGADDPQLEAADQKRLAQVRAELEELLGPSPVYVRGRGPTESGQAFTAPAQSDLGALRSATRPLP
ncbi:MAG TPA: CapA family protein [Bacillota bacterium]